MSAAKQFFQPVAGQEERLADGRRICTRLMSISEMPAFQTMSHEVWLNICCKYS